ncbi:MAG: DNA methyltransferase [Candidatus Hodarchaeota archaeon]
MDFPRKKIERIDWDFPDSTTQYLTHKFHSYPARFIPQIPRTIYDICLASNGVKIFDPFMGCGTTLVEAILTQNHAGGVDLNPLAVLISQVKTKSLNVNRLSEIWQTFQIQSQNIDNVIKKEELSKDESNLNLTDRFEFPNRILSKRFTPMNVQAFSLILDYIMNEITQVDFQNFFKVGLSSTVTTLAESRNWRKVKIWKNFQSKINSMIRIMEDFNKRSKNFNNEMHKDIRLSDSRNVSFISDESIDCIVTSPPYVNALDYNRIHQYNMSILGYDYREFAKGEIGAHGHFISNRWRLLTEYLGDLFQSISEMIRVVKSGSVVCIVIGDSCLEYERIKSHIHVEKIGKLLGLTHHITLSRNIDTTSKSTSKDIGNIFSENLIFFTKEKDFEKETDSVAFEFIEATLQKYLDHVKTSKGTCLRNKPKLSKERRELAICRIEEAISKIKKDSHIL